jgi:phage terminase large subunit-like protein
MARRIIVPEGYRRAEQVRAFAASCITHRKDRWAGTPFILEPWQFTDIVLPVYGTLDKRGRRWYDKALVGLPRWNGKDELAAMLCLHHLFLEPIAADEAYGVATSNRQAGILLDTASGMAKADHDLRAACEFYKREIVMRDTGAVLRTLPHDADTSQGYHPSFAVIDELHVHRNRGMVDAMLTGMVGRDEPLLVVLTTAGEHRAGVWWELLQEWKKDPHAYVYWRGAKDSDDADDRKVWRAANPASWVSMSHLEKMHRTLPRASFERYHLNRAPQSSDASRAFTWKEWQACTKAPLIEPEEPCVVTVDGANKGDCFAILVDRRDEGGIHHVEPYIFDEPPQETGYYDLDEIEELLASLWQTRNVTRLACDPNRLLLLMQRLERHHGIPVEEFPQNNGRMCPAAASLRELVRTGSIRAGRNAALKAHILNAVELPREPWGWRIGKAAKAEKIDGAIALAMAVYLTEADIDVGRPGVSVG